MKRFCEQLHKESESVKMRSAEKHELRERVVSYMEYHPLPAELKTKKVAKVPAGNTPLISDAFTTVSIPFSFLFKSSAVAAALVLVVIPFVAEESVPGDALYAVKVQFNEEIRGTLTFGSYEKIEWETTRLNRRIAEARLLANEGLLTEEVEAEVAEAVRTHTQNAQREIEELRTEDADKAAIASISLDTTLEVQSTSLRADEGQVAGETNDDNLVGLIANAIDESRTETENSSEDDVTPAYDSLMAKVEQNTTRIYELLEVVSEIALTDQLGDVSRRIEDLERSIILAVETVETDDEEARLLLIDALQRTQKLIVYMTEIEVIETVDIEALVPVVLTDVEEENGVVRMTEELSQKIALIEKLLPEVEDEGLVEKANLTLDTLSEKSAEMAIITADFVVFEAVASAAIELADDVITTVQHVLQPEVVAPSPEEESASTTGETNPEIEIKREEMIEETEETVVEEVEPTENAEESVEETDPEVEANEETEETVAEETEEDLEEESVRI